MRTRIGLFVHLVVAIVFLGGLMPAQADWLETFDDNSFDLPTWQFLSYPSYTGSFGGTIQDEADANDYLILAETNSTAAGGSAFGIGVGAPEEFTDVRIGAVINAAGEAAQNYLSLVARVTYLMDDGSLSGHPGAIASGYVMLIHYQDGPANFRIEVMKIVDLSEDIMKTYHEVTAPGVDHARRYYAELEVVGSDPAYITGSIYESQGGPLLVRTPTLVDTQGADPWENSGIHDAAFTKGVSAISSSNQDAEPAGYRATFDTVSSVAIDVADAHAKDVIVDDFEGYENDSDIRVAWVPNITGFDYVTLNKDGNDEQLCLRYQNQYEPYYTEAIRTLEPARNFALGGIGHLSIEFRGQLDNVTQPLFVMLEDAAGNAHAVMYPSVLAPQTKFWREWQVSLQDFEGVDLTAIKKIGIKVGDGTISSQTLDDTDEILLNNVIVRPPQ